MADGEERLGSCSWPTMETRCQVKTASTQYFYAILAFACTVILTLGYVAEWLTFGLI